MTELNYSMRVACQRSGLSPHVIRVWERRYRAVTPRRSGTNRRLYSESEIERLVLLRHAAQAGHRIGDIARLEPDQLRKLLNGRAAPASAAVAGPSRDAAREFLSAALAAIERLNAQELEMTLEQAMLAYGLHGLLEKVIAPLAAALGEHWRAGSLRAAHEHLASGTIRGFLTRMARPFAIGPDAPALIVATPARQLHELGAIMVSAAATDMGWRVTYLGSSLPAAEIAATAIQNQARAVALSIVYPDDDPELPAELETLRRLLPKSIRIMAGGRAAGGYLETLQKVGALHCKALRELYLHLDELRRPHFEPA